ncbi:MAG: helix-turn-helix domain-containing protein [Clostridia bacterium]|nr:helix-turn-helix domain-containing protein [Clostridia bacterium]
MKSIYKVLREIKEIASIDVSLYSTDSLVAINADGEAPSAEFIESIGSEVVYENGNTYFVLRGNSVPYLVRIKGEQSTTVTALVSQLIRNVEVEDFDSLSSENKLRKLLLGELTEIRRHATKNIFGRVDFFTMGLITESHSKQTELENFLDTVRGKDDLIVKVDERFMMYFRKISGEYNNAEDFANILYENVKEELRIDLKIAVVGEITDFETFSASYVRAMETYELGKLFAPNSNVWVYRNFALSKLLITTDKKVLKNTLDSIVKNGSEGVWEDEELMTTADAFINNSLNISETSRVLYIHRNTLMYRLDKIERETGYNLRTFADAVVFKLVTIIRTVLASE